MRMAVGLGGLLITIAVIVWIMGKAELPYDQAVLHASQKATDQVQQLSGRDENGNNIETTYSVFADTRSDGKLQDLQVTQLTPDSPLAHYFGLQKDDVILACVDGHTVRTDMAGLNDDRAGKDAIWDAYTTQGQMVVQPRRSTTHTAPMAEKYAQLPLPLPLPRSRPGRPQPPQPKTKRLSKPRNSRKANPTTAARADQWTKSASASTPCQLIKVTDYPAREDAAVRAAKFTAPSYPNYPSRHFR